MYRDLRYRWIKDANVETAFVSVQLAHQGISDKQAAHQEKRVD
jgi:hypothetical protein